MSREIDVVRVATKGKYTHTHTPALAGDPDIWADEIIEISHLRAA